MHLKKTLIFETALGTYASNEMISEGGAGRIYQATDEDGNEFAIKLLDPAKTSKDKRKRFKNELNFCFKNTHPHIVTVLDSGPFEIDKTRSLFYVMPLFKCSLRKLMDNGIASDKVLPYFDQILTGVQAAHLQGVVHRDLKPDNVLFDDNKDHLLIADFGIAQFEEDALITAVETRDGDRLANFQYAAPEQKRRGEPVDHRADIFALGLILNEMFTKTVPLGTNYPSIASFHPNFGYLDDLVEQMIRLAPDQRPESIDAIKALLIGYKNSFVLRQKISALEKSVIPTTSANDDPLIADPIRIVNADWNDGRLYIFLSQPTKPKWIWALHNMGNFSAAYGAEPSQFRYNGNEASVDARPDDVQKIIDHFKTWIPKVNAVYKAQVELDKRNAETKYRKAREMEIEVKKTRERVIKNIKI